MTPNMRRVIAGGAFSGVPQGYFLRGLTRKARALLFYPAALSVAYVDSLHNAPSALLDKKQGLGSDNQISVSGP